MEVLGTEHLWQSGYVGEDVRKELDFQRRNPTLEHGSISSPRQMGFGSCAEGSDLEASIIRSPEASLADKGTAASRS